MRYLVGVGNYAMSDDGIGLHIVESILQQGLATDFTAIDLSGSGYALMDCFTAETEQILIVDALVRGGEPGSVVFFNPEDVESTKILSGMTTHEGDLLQVIELGRSLGFPIPPLRIMGIEPQSLEPGMALSPALAEKLPEYVALAIRELTT